MQAGPYRAVIRTIMRLEPVTHRCCAWVAWLTWQHHLHGPLPSGGYREGRGSGTYPPEEPASAQHHPAHWGWICRAPRCQDLGSSQERRVSPKPQILSPTQWKQAGTEITKLPHPAHAVWVSGSVGRGLALGVPPNMGREGGRVHAPTYALQTDTTAARTLLFQRLDEPGHSRQRLLGEGGVLGELCLPREPCDGKMGRRGLDTPACRNSSLFPWLPQDRIKLLLWHSHNQHFSSCMSNFGELLPYFILFLQ